QLGPTILSARPERGEHRAGTEGKGRTRQDVPGVRRAPSQNQLAWKEIHEDQNELEGRIPPEVRGVEVTRRACPVPERPDSRLAPAGNGERAASCTGRARMAGLAHWRAMGTLDR